VAQYEGRKAYEDVVLNYLGKKINNSVINAFKWTIRNLIYVKNEN
jgi:hypothetical protein